MIIPNTMLPSDDDIVGIPLLLADGSWQTVSFEWKDGETVDDFKKRYKSNVGNYSLVQFFSETISSIPDFHMCCIELEHHNGDQFFLINCSSSFGCYEDLKDSFLVPRNYLNFLEICQRYSSLFKHVIFT